MGSNKLLPIVAGVVLLMVVFIGVKSCRQSDETDNISLTRVPTAPRPDADSPAETIRTLTAEVAAIKNQSHALQQQNNELLKQRNEIAQRVKQEVSNDLRLTQMQHDNPLFDQLTTQFSQLKTRLEEINAAQNKAVTTDFSGDIPLGLGLEGQRLSGPPPLVWVEPLGTTTGKNQPPVYLPTPSLNNVSGHTGRLLPTEADHQDTTQRYLTASADITDSDIPAYTVPRNATLIGSTGMTALIGKIPRNSTLDDPFPFKAIVGRNNLAANGITIPGLNGMIFSGIASGDWALSCVRGTLHSVTYVFSDGTIRTLSSDDNSLQQLQTNQGNGSNTARDLGWISDRRGIPCITGTRISNASDYLAGRIAARAIQAGSEAFALNETTQVVSPVLGTTTSVITGDAAQFAGLNALAGGADEISQYLAERAAQAFDVVFVDTGVELAIHIDQALPIDYVPQGRKTTYAFHDQSLILDLD